MDKRDSVSIDMQTLMIARSCLYSTFSSIFGSMPSEGTFRLYEYNVLEEAFHIVSSRNFVDGVFKRFLVCLEEGVDCDTLKHQYTRLFIGPGTPLAQPWEAMYTTNDKRLLGPVALEVRKAYRAEGVQAEGYPHVSDDALSLELGFLGILAKQAADLAATEKQPVREIQASKDFLDKHLLLWVGKCCDNICLHAHDSFYEYAAQALKLFVTEDRKSLSLLDYNELDSVRVFQRTID